MSQEAKIPSGTERIIDGQRRVYHDGYWIKTYSAPDDTLLMKKRLIEALTRRLFNHVEHGLNVPGSRLDEARRAYDAERDPKRRRVKGAMLAGALFNRAADIFTKLVEIQALGVEIEPENPLMQQCGEHLEEALGLGRSVFHRSGDEGIDELWGEPLKAFLYPIDDFYRSRYVKIALTMRDIDQMCAELKRALSGFAPMAGIAPLVDELAKAAKVKCETLRTDPEIFEVWTSFVVARERLDEFEPAGTVGRDAELVELAMKRVREATRLVEYITRARVPMPKSTANFVEACRALRSRRSSLRSPAPNAHPQK